MIGSALPMLALSVGLAVPSQAADGWTREQVEARYEQYRERINELRAEGRTQPEVDLAIAQEFDIVRIGVPYLNTDALTDAKKETDDAGGGATSATSLTMYTPTFSYDNQLRKYVMAASWQWKQCADYDRPCWLDDGSGTGPDGGPDGMALKINRPVYRYTGGISTSDNCGSAALNNNQPDDDPNGYGLSFIEQDTVRYSSSNGACLGTPYRYDWHRGTVSETFTFQSGCDANTTVQVDAKIGHTWNTTSVNSISLGKTSISFSWSTSSHKWNAIPATPGYGSC